MASARLEEMAAMSLNSFQTKAMKSAIYRDEIGKFVDECNASPQAWRVYGREWLVHMFSLLYAACGAAGEVGEVCNQVKKVLRDDGGRLTLERASKLCGEVGGCMWYINGALPEEIGVAPSVIAGELFDELDARANKGTLQGDGDKRG